MRIYEQPANLFVAGFLGNPAMNLWRGRCKSEAGGLALVGECRPSLSLGSRSLLQAQRTSGRRASGPNTVRRQSDA